MDEAHQAAWHEQHDQKQERARDDQLEVGERLGGEQQAAQLLVQDGDECRTGSKLVKRPAESGEICSVEVEEK